MRVVGSHKSALSRQIAEAVRIRRRGGEGSILNSKSEYNRCHIPRLRVEDKEEEEDRERMEQEDVKRMMEELDKEQNDWELDKTRSKDRERREIAKNVTVRRELNGRKRNNANSKGVKGPKASSAC